MRYIQWAMPPPHRPYQRSYIVYIIGMKNSLNSLLLLILINLLDSNFFLISGPQLLLQCYTHRYTQQYIYISMAIPHRGNKPGLFFSTSVLSVSCRYAPYQFLLFSLTADRCEGTLLYSVLLYSLIVFTYHILLVNIAIFVVFTFRTHRSL